MGDNAYTASICFLLDIIAYLFLEDSNRTGRVLAGMFRCQQTWYFVYKNQNSEKVELSMGNIVEYLSQVFLTDALNIHIHTSGRSDC